MSAPLDSSALTDLARRALTLLQGGRTSEADAVCRQILQSDSRHFHALHLLGIAALVNGDHARAMASFGAAVESDPAQPAAHSNLAAALLRLHRPRESLESCERALKLKPDFAEALANRGHALCALGSTAEALASYDRSIQLAPRLGDAHFGRGNALQSLGREREALVSYQRALEVNPGHTDALSNLGRALLKLDEPQKALEMFDRALRTSPTLADALNGRGSALRMLRRLPEAIESYETALRTRPDFAEVFHNLARVWLELDEPARAVASCDQALSLRADLADAWNIRAQALGQLKRYDEAVESCERLLALQPEFDYAAGARLSFQSSRCDWSQRTPRVNQILQTLHDSRAAMLPFSFLAVSDSAAAQLECARIFVAARCPARAPLWQGERYQHDRIRVAYVSGDLHDHAVSYLLAGLFERHNRARFETYAVSLRPQKSDELAQRVKQAFDHFIEVGDRSDREVAGLLHDMQIDIAVDLAGFTRGSRTDIFAYRPVPIQVNYLGFPATMGADYIDYLIADEWVIPAGSRRFYSESVVYLPDCFQCNDDRRPLPCAAPHRGSAGLPDDGFVFCSFNGSHKLNPEMFDIWMQLLRQISGSVLWLLGGSADVRGNLCAEAERRGIDSGRLLFAERVDYRDHLARLQLADLFLDSLPFNAGTTASDALWAGLPVLTCSGEALAARMAGSLLRTLDVPELVTSSRDEYTRTAIRLAQAPQELRRLRERLLENRERSPLFDTDRFRRHLESAYVQMWERLQRGEGPASFAVAPLTRAAEGARESDPQ